MKTLKPFLTAAAAIAAPAALVALPVPAAAQVSGIAVADPEGAIAQSNAWKTAASQIQTTYKAQIDQAQARSTALTNELRPLITAFENARNQPNPNQQSLQTQAQQIQQRQTAAREEIARLTEPAERARAYALEQITRQLNAAVDAAVKRKNVSLLLRPEAALFATPAANITADITAELNRLVPSVSITPPAGWQPGQAQAQQQPAAQPAQQQQQQPQGR